MRFRRMTGCGKLAIDFSDPYEKGTLVSRNFLRELIERAVRRSTAYYRNTHDHVFRYGERQLHSVICPSIADMVGNEHGSAFLFEHPLMRKRSGEEEYRGAIDYWVMYRDFAFLIELKHSYFAYNRKNPRQSISKKFIRALEQLEIVRKPERVELATGCKDIVAVVLETVVFFKRSERKLTRAAFREDDFGKHFVRLNENLHCKKKPNVHCLWVLDEKLVNDFEYSDCHEIYPAIAFIGHISHKSVRSA